MRGVGTFIQEGQNKSPKAKEKIEAALTRCFLSEPLEALNLW